MFGKKKMSSSDFKELLERESYRNKIIKGLEKKKFKKKVTAEWKKKNENRHEGIKKIFRL